METIGFYMEYQHDWIDHPMTVSIFFDDRMIHLDQGHAKTIIDKKVSLLPGSHVLKIKITNKNEFNTIVDEKGKIIKDSVITIKNLIIDDININKIIEVDSDYHTRTQGTLKSTSKLGLNGEWCLPIKTPVYKWILEKLY